MTGKDKRDVKRIIFEYFEYIERDGLNPVVWTDFVESLECRGEKRKE
jgi:hypothetical protein